MIFHSYVSLPEGIYGSHLKQIPMPQEHTEEDRFDRLERLISKSSKASHGRKSPSARGEIYGEKVGQVRHRNMMV